MKPVSRHPVNKHRSAKQFGHHTRTVAAANIQIGPSDRDWETKTPEGVT